jgi:transmembrane sensor
MTEEIDHIVQLIVKRLKGQLSSDEAETLKRWSETHPIRGQTQSELGEISNLSKILQEWKQHDNRQIDSRLEKEFPGITAARETHSLGNRAAHRLHFLKTAWVRYAAAIIILFGIGAYLWSTTETQTPPITKTRQVPITNDRLPGSDRAILTLSTGKQVQLNRGTAETILDGTLSIENSNGRLIYKQGDKVAINTMSTPNGGQYQLTLADGTKVWLNAASSITYPTAFAGTSREVSITGEAYFEVTRNHKQPFIVKTLKEEVTVLGTSFNVNAYAEEPAMKTSLIQGSVKVGKVVIRPGYAYINGKVIPTDIEQDVAWKNGAFNFRNVDTEAAFRQLARWYNVEVRFAGAVPSKLGGKIGRDLNLSQVVKALEDIGIHTRIEGNTMVVLPE